MAGALSGLRVIDFGHQVAGPLVGVMLADQGADVIHIDRAGVEDRPADAFFLRGKRRIRLDLLDTGDLQIARRLVDSADVLIENFRPVVMSRLGLGAGEMMARNPRLIYCSLPGFPEGDPRAGMRAWEGIIDAATDNGRPRAGEPPPEWDSTRPTYSALTLASNMAAFHAAGAIVLALIARERGGRGQRVEAALFDSMFTLIGQNGAWLHERGWREPNGIHGRGAGCFRCSDGRYVQFDTSSARHLTWFAHAAGIDHWGADYLDISRLQDPQVNQALHARLRELFLARPAAEWERLGNAAGAAIGMVRTSTEWLHEGHAHSIGAVSRLDDPVLGAALMAGLPVRLSLTDGEPGAARHLPDADRQAILQELEHWPARAPGDDADVGEAPLAGLRVLDLCLALAGPTSGRLLCEAGAEVIKVYSPDAGVGGYLNRGKRSLLFDLAKPEGQQLFWKLVESADVVIQNFAPGTAERLGIGFDQVKARRPGIVYTSVSCYGLGGPWSAARGWERQGQAVTGIMERTASIPAILGPYNIVDIGTGTLAAFGTALALYHRARTGEGQHVSASLVQTATYQQAAYMLDYEGVRHEEPRGYEAQGTGALNRYYRAQDQWFFLAATGSEEELAALMQVDPGASAVEQVLGAAFATETAGTWTSRLQDAGIAAMPVVPLAQLMDNEAVRARGLAITQAVDGKEATMPGTAVRLSATPLRPGDRVHRPGSDAKELLEEIGWSDRLDELERRWVLRTTDLPPAWAGGG